MTLELTYPDTASFYTVASDGYRGTKAVVEQEDVPVIFVQSTSFVQGQFQEGIDADAICFPDFTNEFIAAQHNRLEGMYVKMNLYGSTDQESWYKITTCTVNRDHLLGNDIDNIECALKKTTALEVGVS